MKKVIAFTLIFLILLTVASCGNKAEESIPATTVPETAAPETTVSATTEATEPAETTEPTIPAPTEPEWEPGVVRAGYGEGVYRTFSAGTQLKVIGQFKNYYVVEQEDADLLVSKDMLRMDSEAAFESWNGYSTYGTEVFDNPYLRGEPNAVLGVNTPVIVLESNGPWAYIQWDTNKGYARVDMLSKWRITGGSGGGNGGYDDGTDVSVDSLCAVQGSVLPQIQLLGAYFGPEMEKDFEGGMANVLADETEGYICLLLRSDEVRVTAWDDDVAAIWLGEDWFARIPRAFVKLEGEKDYESWTGYSGQSGILYEEYQLVSEMETLSINTQVLVLDEVNDRYVVEYEGKIGYMEMDKVSQEKIVIHSGNGGGGDVWTPSKL